MRSRGASLKAAVDKIKAFLTIFVYFGAACASFGGCVRQNQGISLHFCLLRRSRGAFLKAAADKIQAFLTVFVYFDGRAGPFLEDALDKIQAFLTVFVYFDGRVRQFWRMQ